MTVAVSNLTRFLASPDAAAAVQEVVATLGQVPSGYTSVTMTAAEQGPAMVGYARRASMQGATVTAAAQGSAMVGYAIAIPVNAPPNIDTTGASIAAAFEAVTPGQMMQLLSAALSTALDNSTYVLNVTMGPVEHLDMLSTTTRMGNTTTSSSASSPATGPDEIAAQIYVPLLVFGSLFLLALLVYLLYACRCCRAGAAKGDDNTNETMNVTDDAEVAARAPKRDRLFLDVVEV